MLYTMGKRQPFASFTPTASQGRLVVYFEIYRLFFINSAENVKKTTFPLSLLCMSKKITTFAADFKKAMSQQTVDK